MLKKMIIIAVLFVGLPISSVNSSAAEPLHVTVNGKGYLASQFIIKDNRVYGNIDTISSMMGALNSWVFKENKSVSFITHFSKEGNSDEFYTWFKHSNKVEIRTQQSGEENIRIHTMTNSTIISKDDEIFLPLRESIIALGKTISWDSSTNKITVTGKITY